MSRDPPDADLIRQPRYAHAAIAAATTPITPRFLYLFFFMIYAAHCAIVIRAAPRIIFFHAEPPRRYR